MAVTTRMTWNEEKHLQKLLGNASLSLLYKSSVHGSSFEDMSQKCSNQGSTMIIIYCWNCTLGVFLLDDFPKFYKDFKKPYTSFFFSLKKKRENNIIESPTLFSNTVLKITDKSLEFYESDVLQLSIPLETRKQIVLNYLIEKELEIKCKSYINTSIVYEECEVFRVEGIKNDPDYIKKLTAITKHRNSLLADLRTYKPYANLVSEIRILLLGPVGSGKSSFFNSVKSIFQSHITHQAIVGSDKTSMTEQYRIYPVRDGKEGKYLPFMFCDTMGLDETDEIGLCIEDIPQILRGCVPDRYQFNPCEPITHKHPTFISSPSLKDRIHCVAYVLDINSINNLSSRMVAKLRRIHEEVLDCGTAHVALLTRVKHCDEVLQSDFSNMTKNMTFQSQVMTINRMLGIPISNILMVRNYASERELNHMQDVLILSVLRQMLRLADDFLEDLPPKETE